MCKQLRNSLYIYFQHLNIVRCISLKVTKRCDTDEGQWSNWNWRTDGDVMVNGAFFVPSGGGFSTQYAKASSVEPKSSVLIDRLTINAGVLGGPRYTLPYLLLLYVPLQLKNISHFNCLKISFAFIYLGFDKRTGALCRGSRLSHHSKTLFDLYKILNFSPCLSPIF